MRQMLLPFRAAGGKAVKHRKEPLLREFEEKYSNERAHRRFERALALAHNVHRAKVRDSGDPYIEHPMTVAKYAMDYGCTPAAVTAALLHDVIEDGNVHRKYLLQEFGRVITRMVVNLTKPKYFCGLWVFADDERYYTVDDEYRKDLYHERTRVYYDALINSADLDSILVKLFDNLHNLKTLSKVSKDKMSRNAETIARHSILIVSRLFDASVLDYFMERIKTMVPHIDVDRYLYANSPRNNGPIVVVPQRASLNLDMFRMLPLPGQRKICVYGNEKSAYITDTIEVGFPKEARHKFDIIRNALESFRVRVGKSMLPETVGAHEFIVRVHGFRRDRNERIRATTNRVHFKIGNADISFPKTELDNGIKVSGPDYEFACRRFAELKERLERLHGLLFK